MENNIIIFEDNNKPKILFLHGFNSEHNFVSPLLKLKRKYDIISFDFPGCGKNKINKPVSIESYSEYANKIIDQISEPIFIVGHSLGGAIAMNVANNKWVKKIILLAPLNPFVEDKEIEKWLLPENINQAYDSMFNLVGNKNKKIYFNNLKKTTNTFYSSIKQKRNIFQYIVYEQITNQFFLKNTLLNTFKNNQKDTIIIQGTEDNFIDISSIISLQNEFNFETEFIENTGHAIIYERPRIINKLLNKII